MPNRKKQKIWKCDGFLKYIRVGYEMYKSGYLGGMFYAVLSMQKKAKIHRINTSNINDIKMIKYGQ
jgi:hypothetical protein